MKLLKTITKEKFFKTIPDRNGILKIYQKKENRGKTILIILIIIKYQ
jgi:hypothetical protein